MADYGVPPNPPYDIHTKSRHPAHPSAGPTTPPGRFGNAVLNQSVTDFTSASAPFWLSTLS